MVPPVSTVLPPADGAADHPGPPLRNKGELIAYFAAGEKPREQFRVGTEHEKFGFMRADKSPLAYEGPSGIEALLQTIVAESADDAEGPWREVLDNGRLIALYRGAASISLEPGGQLELSGAPLKTLHETCEEVGEHLRILKRASLPKGVGFIGLGFHPTAACEDMPTVPKSRYGIMRRYMPTRGKRGLDMMKRTATVQANFDFASEGDMARSAKTAFLISPLITPLFANSPFVEGKPAGALSERTRVWADTDPDRSGYPQVMLDEGFGYERLVDWVLDVPMYFVRRDGVHHDFAGASFRQLMSEQGLGGYRATMRDFEDHLTTVFPEVRLKRYLEVRSADCGPWSRICALPALWKGVLYDEQAKDEAAGLLEGASGQELFELQQEAAVRGFDASFRGKSLHSYCERLLDISRGGLERIAASEGLQDETGFLRPLVTVVQERRTFAERLLDKYRDEWCGDISGIWNEIEFFAED
jgi:glutamate--cysteine ligase